MHPLTDAQKDPDPNPFGKLGAMMAGTKLAMQDHACARRIVTNFIQGKTDDEPAGSNPKWLEAQNTGIDGAADLLLTV
jgi:hypothetical protein